MNGICRCSSDYYTMAQAEFLHEKMKAWDNRLWNNGVAGPNYAREHCGDAVLPYQGFETWVEIDLVVNRALAAKNEIFGPDGQGGFYSRLLVPNRHFGPGRSTVYKPATLVPGTSKTWFEAAEDLLNGTGTEANPNGPVSRLDGIKGRCDEILQ